MPQGPTERQWEALTLTLPSGFLVGHEEGGVSSRVRPPPLNPVSASGWLCDLLTQSRCLTLLCLVSKMATVTAPSLYVCED